MSKGTFTNDVTQPWLYYWVSLTAIALQEVKVRVGDTICVTSFMNGLKYVYFNFEM